MLHQGEQIIYQDHAGVLISTSRAVFGQQTYAMAQVSAVAAYSNKPDRTGPVLTILAGICVFLVGTFGWFAFDAPVAVAGGGALGLVLGGIGVFWYASQKTTYGIYLNTSGGQIQAWVSQDWPYISRLNAALQQALVMRG